MEPLNQNLKDLFAEWLQEEAIEHTKKGTKMALVYNRALERVRRHDGSINDPKELKKIQYVGDKTVQLLCKKLQNYCKKHNFVIPAPFESLESAGEKRRIELDDKQKPKRARKSWVPKRRAGSWAMLIALHLRDHRRVGLRKEEIIETATPYCDTPFTANPASHDYHSAWDGMKTLIKREYVSASASSPKIYFLTDEGMEVARVIIKQENIVVSPVRQQMDVSFDNGVRVTPDTSRLFVSSSQSVLSSKQPSPHIQKSVLQSSPLKEKSILQTSPAKQKPLRIHDRVNKTYDGIAYDVWTSSEFTVLPIIDNREVRSRKERDFFLERLSSQNIDSEVRSLTLGDVVWIAKHKSTGKEVILDFICERKRIDDLAASIKDGRFQEQKSRLKKSGMKHVYYLVEECGVDYLDMVDSIKTSISMTVTVSNFYLRKFKSIESTISFIASLTKVIQNQYSTSKLMVLKPRSIDNQSEYSEQLDIFREKFELGSSKYHCCHTFSLFQDAMLKTGMMTVKEMFILMLMATRGISFDKALIIQRHFQTPKALIQYFVENRSLPETKRKGLLVELFKHEVGNKKIGKVALESLYEVWGSED